MNIVIGVGGTGAKVVEAIIHFATMGVGPTAMRVGFVDQDSSNGNLNRALQVFETYRRARAAWRDQGAVHRIDGSEECPLLKTSLEPLGENGGLWVPDSREGASLASVFGPMGADKFLFDALYHTGDDPETEEQRLSLDVGYRGRPHVGAALMTDRAEARGAFWDGITETIKTAGMGSPVRILLAGSVFGGTGAAGFPTIARIIRDRLRAQGITRGVEIGGVLMLPYFGFPDPGEADDKNVALADEQLMQSRGALRHYQQMLGGSHIFDQLYLVGANPIVMIDYHKKGAGGQRNPALLPEFLAASASARFFLGDKLADEEESQEIMVSARRDHFRTGWPDLPAIDTGTGTGEKQRVLHEKISRFLRFAVAFKFWKPQIGDANDRKALRKQKWYGAQGLDQVDWDTASPSQALNDLEASLDHALRWFAAMDAYGRRDQDHVFDLWRVGEPLVERLDFAAPNEDARVTARLGDADYKRLYSSVVQKYSAEDDEMGDAAALGQYLIDYEVDQGHQKMGRFIAALYHFSDVRPIVAG